MTQDVETFFALRPGPATRLDGSAATLTVRDVGVLHVPSGVVEACDPLVNLGAGPSFAVPPGSYPVRVTVADVSPAQDGSHEREAYLSLVLAEGTPVRVRPAEETGRPSEECPSVTVQAGVVGLADHVAVSGAMARGEAQWYHDVADKAFTQMVSPGPGCTARVTADGTDVTTELPSTVGTENVVLVRSGWRNGSYPVLVTEDADDQMLAVHVDLGVVGPQTDEERYYGEIEPWVREDREARAQRWLAGDDPLGSIDLDGLKHLIDDYTREPAGLTVRQAERLARAATAAPQLSGELTGLAYQSHGPNEPVALAVYRTMLAVPPPDPDPDRRNRFVDHRTEWLRAANNALVLMNTEKLDAEAVVLADRVVQYARENPHITHSAACAYAAVGRYDDALEQVRLAVALGYENLDKLRVDADLGPLLERAEFAQAFADVSLRVAALVGMLEKEHPDEAALIAGFVVAGDEPARALSVDPSTVDFFLRSSTGNQYLWVGGKSYWSNRSLRPLAKQPDLLTTEQWLRLGQVYGTAPKYSALSKRWPPAVPAWFLALQDARAEASSAAHVWNPELVVSLLTAGGAIEDEVPGQALAAFFALLAPENSWTDTVRPWSSPCCDEGAAQARVWVDYVAANVAAVPSAVAPLGADGRLRALTWLGVFPELLPPLAPMLVEHAVAASKTVREQAMTLVVGLDEPLRSQTLAAVLAEGKGTTISTAVDFTARLGETGRALLTEALAEGRGGKRDELLAAAVNRNEMSAAPQTEIDVPPAPPLDAAGLGEEFVTALDGVVARWLEGLQKQASPWNKGQLELATRLGPSDFVAVRDWLNGDGPKPPWAGQLPDHHMAGLGLPLISAVRYATRDAKPPQLHEWALFELAGYDYDLRTMAEAVELAGIDQPVQTVGNLVFGWRGDGYAPEQVWPFFATYPDQLDEMVDKVGNGSVDATRTLQVLAMFPTLPATYVPVVAQLATGEAKTHRRAAQELLKDHPNVLGIAVEGLKSGKGEVRAAAAAWIGRLGDPAGVEVLRSALAKEKREQPQAAMLTALRTLGDDISAHLAPQVLATTAAKGLAGRRPAGMDWFPLDALPACRWADETPVDPDTVRWWAVLAVKLKDPVGAGLLPLYVSLLDTASQEALGTFVLDAWVARDTTRTSDEDCRAYAAANVDASYDRNQAWAKQHPDNEWCQELGRKTKDQVFDELRQARAGEYLGSAIGEKGLLALTTGTPGHHVLAVCQRYVREHPQRRSQVEALIVAAAANDDPSAIQLVLSVARKFKQETVRAKANELAEQIAERQGWTLDELADRTIPTAGFDDTGTLTLDYGPRAFTGRITRSPKTGAFTIEVSTADGKTVKALPKPGAKDDADIAAASRKQLTTSKKELTQVAALQASRLFEAMCLGRTWDVEVWRELDGHPVMSHLMSTLVWQVWESSQAHDAGGPYQLFRPADGELLDADDETVTLPDDGRVGLAHLATVTPAEAAQWRAHLVDYGVDPLFSQMESVSPTYAPDATEISDHKGWLSDSFAIRGRATKRGYSRGMAEDGGWFCEYTKDLPGAKIQVVIEFTGSYVPEEQIAAAVQTLHFRRSGRPLPLADVPAILLAESYADYVDVAQAGTFDPDWEKKSEF